MICILSAYAPYDAVALLYSLNNLFILFTFSITKCLFCCIVHMIYSSLLNKLLLIMKQYVSYCL